MHANCVTYHPLQKNNITEEVCWCFSLSLCPPGVVRQIKPLVGPLSTVLKLSMRNISHQGESGQNIINVHVFVSEFWFWWDDDFSACLLIFFPDTALTGSVIEMLQSVSDFNIVPNCFWQVLSWKTQGCCKWEHYTQPEVHLNTKWLNEANLRKWSGRNGIFGLLTELKVHACRKVIQGYDDLSIFFIWHYKPLFCNINLDFFPTL